VARRPWRDDATTRTAVERSIRAFEADDVDGVVALLTDDVVLEMPPVPLWFFGPTTYGRFIARVPMLRGRGWRMVRTSANGQAALAAYCPDSGCRPRPHTLRVLTVTSRGIARATSCSRTLGCSRCSGYRRSSSESPEPGGGGARWTTFVVVISSSSSGP
jgi:SnoaL-like domain